MTRKYTVVGGLATMALCTLNISEANTAVVLDFEGLQDLERVLDYYDDGLGGNGSGPGEDYGISFSPSALALIDADDGGSGNIGGEPSEPTAMVFLEGSAILNMSEGFDTGFSFSYSAPFYTGTVKIYEGENATGALIKTVNLPTTASDGGDPTGDYSPFFEVGVPIEGIARSIDFGGTANYIAYDDVTFGSATPGETFDFPFLVEDPKTSPGYSSKLRTAVLDAKNGAVYEGTFDENAATIVITHGWQPSQSYDDPDFNFSSVVTPEGQLNVESAIIQRLHDVYGGGSTPKKVNIVLFEWAGAYTGGEIGNDGVFIGTGSVQARNNADYAGVLLGAALESTFGSNYDQDVHFIGHSYGTVVNTLATRYLDVHSPLSSARNVQFTILDAPTNPFAYDPWLAPNLYSGYFDINLSSQVDYLDNYYGTFGPGNLAAYGEAEAGAGINQVTAYGHSAVFGNFYSDLVANGPSANTNPIGPDLFQYSHKFSDWVTPVLSTYNSRTGGDFTAVLFNNQNVLPVSNVFQTALGTPVIVTTLPPQFDYQGFSFAGLKLPEQSPVSVYQAIEIPIGAEWLAFDWLVSAPGDGDWITAHFEDDLLWSMMLDDLLTGSLMDTFLDMRSYQGDEGRLFFTLNSVGEKNAEFYFGNLRFLGEFNQVPVGPAILFIVPFLLLLAGLKKRRLLVGS